MENHLVHLRNMTQYLWDKNFFFKNFFFLLDESFSVAVLELLIVSLGVYQQMEFVHFSL